MSVSISSTSVLQAVARSLVARQKSPNIEAALNEIALGWSSRKYLITAGVFAASSENIE
jgi:hypothetical protein